jgi:protein SCO1/2
MRSEIAVGLAVALLAIAPVRAHDMQHMHPEATQKSSKQPAAAVPDLPVLNQDGKRLQFYSDLMRGRTVAINFIYTSCTTFCPMLTANFRMVQQELGARIGKDIELISISIDPVTDTPAKLKAFGAQFEPGPGWTFVTGALPDIGKLLDKLGQPLANPADHTPLVLVRNDKIGGWTHVDGNDPKAVREALVTADELQGHVPDGHGEFGAGPGPAGGQGRPLDQHDLAVGRSATGPAGRTEGVRR